MIKGLITIIKHIYSKLKLRLIIIIKVKYLNLGLIIIIEDGYFN